MGSGSNTHTTLHKLQTTGQTISKTASQTPIKTGDWLFWYENYRNEWNGGRVVEADKVFGGADEEETVYPIQGTDWILNELEWAVAEGRIKSSHVFNLDRDGDFKNHEIRYIKSVLTGKGTLDLSE